MLNIEIISDNEVKFIGKLDASQEKTATKALDELEGELVIDMEELSYISSMGLGILLKKNHLLKKDGHELILKNLNKHVRDVFRLTRLEEVFNIVE